MTIQKYEPEIELASTKLQSLYDSLLKEPISKVDSLARGLRSAGNLYTTKFMGKKDNALLEVSSNQTNFKLGINALRWVSKYLYPDVVIGFETVYRIHDFKNYRKRVKVGETLEIQPIKSMLSFSENKHVKVKGIYWGRGNYSVVSMIPNQHDIIWSWKGLKYKEEVSKFRLKLLDDLYVQEVENSKVWVPKQTTSNKEVAVYRVFKFLSYLMSMTFQNRAEKEVCVYNAGKPFTVSVVKNYDWKTDPIKERNSK